MSSEVWAPKVLVDCMHPRRSRGVDPSLKHKSGLWFPRRRYRAVAVGLLDERSVE